MIAPVALVHEDRLPRALLPLSRQKSSEMDYVHIIVTESLQSVKPVLVNAQA